MYYKMTSSSSGCPKDNIISIMLLILIGLTVYYYYRKN